MVPQAVDTPIFDHAANHSGRAVRPVPPIVDAETVAAGIVACAESPKREVTYSRSGRALELLRVAAPPLYRRIAPGLFADGTFLDEPAEPGSGNLFVPTPGSTRGGWKDERRRKALGALAASAKGLLRA